MHQGGQGAVAERARGLYEHAIAAGRMDALHGLGWLLLTGQGGERDLDEGLKLLAKAAEAGDPRSRLMLQLYAGALACYERAALAGHTQSMHNLAYLYLEGKGVEQDTATGLAWMRRSAESGEAMAQFHLGIFLTQGVLTAPDPAEAVSWYCRAAAQGLPMAMHNLGWCYLQGTGVEVDPRQALALFRQAAAAGQRESASMVQRLQGMVPLG
jgi:TPR repeat protein